MSTTTDQLLQRADALKRANEARAAKARDRERIKSKRGIDIADELIAIVLDPPPHWCKITVGLLLDVPQGWGALKTRAVLGMANMKLQPFTVDASIKLGSLTDRQRQALVRAIEFETLRRRV